MESKYKIGDKVILINGTPAKEYGGANYYNNTYWPGTEGYIVFVGYNNKTKRHFYAFSINLNEDNFAPIVHDDDLKIA